MRIIKQGKKKEDKEISTTCRQCDTRFAFFIREAQKHYTTKEKVAIFIELIVRHVIILVQDIQIDKNIR